MENLQISFLAPLRFGVRLNGIQSPQMGADCLRDLSRLSSLLYNDSCHFETPVLQ